MQFAALLYKENEPVNYEALHLRSKELVGADLDLTGSMMVYTGSSTPVLYYVMACTEDMNPKRTENFAKAAEQSWNCEDARERISQCDHIVDVFEMVASVLEPRERLRIFHSILQAAVEITKPHAIHFLHSQQILDPELYLEDCSLAPVQRRGAINVRFFRAANGDSGEMIMDTRGLEEVGLQDLQCHFKNLEPREVASLLFGTAAYLVENGAVIESGNTIEGLNPGSKWRCQLEEAIIEPKRSILDINPGSPHAAGGRS